jgi:peroxiredoxin Q/BCP
MGLLDSLIGTGTGLSVGTQAPEFTLNDQHGKPVSLADFRGKKSVVVYFYPKDDTPGCTAEACSFRDQFAEFTDAGAEVIGISSDSEASHKKFAEKHRLPFTLLSDKGRTVRAAYGIPATLGLLPGRVTFVIDKQGIVQLAFNSQINATKHVAESLAVIKAAR